MNVNVLPETNSHKKDMLGQIATELTTTPVASQKATSAQPPAESPLLDLTFPDELVGEKVEEKASESPSLDELGGGNFPAPQDTNRANVEDTSFHIIPEPSAPPVQEEKVNIEQPVEDSVMIDPFASHEEPVEEPTITDPFVAHKELVEEKKNRAPAEENDGSDMAAILSATITKLQSRQAVIAGIKEEKLGEVEGLNETIKTLKEKVSELKSDVTHIDKENEQIVNNVGALEIMRAGKPVKTAQADISVEEITPPVVKKTAKAKKV